MSTEQTTEPEPKQSQRLAAGFRALADMLDANPDLADVGYCFSYIFEAVNIPVDSREQIATLARAGMRAGAKVDKHQDDNYAGVNISFGSVGLHVYADRDEVCERIVVGTKEVTEEVPDPEALAAVPKVTVTKVVEEVEWRCGSLLSPTPAQVAEAALVAS